MRTNEEPADGIPLKFTFPDGTMKIRRFHIFDQMQVKLLNNSISFLVELSRILG